MTTFGHVIKTKQKNTKINDQIWPQDIQTKNEHIKIGHFQLCHIS